MSARPPERQQPKDPARIRRVDVLVLLLVVTIVLLLLVPALQKVRVDHARVACMNNMKQLGYAVHAYTTTRKGRMPTGTVIGSAKAPEERLSLMVSLLPYLKQETLFKKLDLEQGWRAERNKPFVEQPLSIFRCPADTRQDLEYRIITNYVGIAGFGDDAATLPAESPGAGSFGYDRKPNIAAAFSDGASQTLLFLETTKDNGPWAAGGRATLRGVDPNDEQPIRSGGAFGLVHEKKRWFQATPLAYSNATLADGSVRSVTPNVSVEVLLALATGSGGEQVPPNW